ncbi:MAG: ribosome-associated translation inhibitor RaiA [Planctomycetota bacterium]|jgi:ribosomal subunit interface protein|nr:ribosome-associated translation inhibitor RaiA [Planctomycetota bacterium]
MDIQITARKIEIAQDLREEIGEKLAKLEKFNPRAKSLEAVIRAEDRRVDCELIIHIENHGSVVIEVSGDTIQAAVDIACGKAERQLRKGKERERESVRRRAAPRDE